MEHTCRTKLGLTFDPWQNQAGSLALAKRSDGRMAATIDGVGMSICRQAGKTHWMTGLIFALCIIRPGTLVVWSAHHSRTHGETFLSMVAFAERLRVAPYIEQVYLGSGDEEVRFGNGSRILFGAREHGFGRGIPGVDVIVADEAQIMSEKAVDAMTATMNVSDFGLMFYLGTPPTPEDKSEAFTRMRDEAWNGTLRDGVWIEFGAEPGSDPNSSTTWARANPSFPHRTPAESMKRLQRKLSPESFLREGLGIWDDAAAAAIVSADRWRDRIGDGPESGKAPDAFGVAAHDGQFSVIACWADAEKRHVEEVFAHLRLDLVCDWVAERAGRRAPVLVPNYGAAAPLQPMLHAKRVNAKTSTTGDVGRGCELIVEGATAGWLSHADQQALADSLAGARKKLGRDGAAWTFDLKASTQNAPAMGMALALAGAAKARRSENQRSTRRVRVMN
ncbi:terminase [Gordonia sp. DT219]|uniref:terminase n=1 Tax=Gordonia sp. DT219 TaxID=3416658 RepID=UPI003CE8254C